MRSSAHPVTLSLAAALTALTACGDSEPAVAAAAAAEAPAAEPAPAPERVRLFDLLATDARATGLDRESQAAAAAGAKNARIARRGVCSGSSTKNLLLVRRLSQGITSD